VPSDHLVGIRFVSFLSWDGSLWVGAEAGLAHLVNGRLTLYEKGWLSEPLIEDRDGKIWFLHVRPSGRTHSLCQVLQGEVHCYGNEDRLDIPGSGAIAQDASGDLWVGSERSLVRWRPVFSGPSKVYRPKALQPFYGQPFEHTGSAKKCRCLLSNGRLGMTLVARDVFPTLLEDAREILARV
jgi:hypothetical protein